MKKAYETPSVEVVRFQYSDQVVASSGGGDFCTTSFLQNSKEGPCFEREFHSKN
jgi:hypothetical protein